MPASTFANEADFIRAYNIHDYDIPLASVDICIFTLLNNKLNVLCVKRSDYPFKNRWALPGGFVDKTLDKSLEDTALRKLTAKTGVVSPYLEQVTTVSSHIRDPRTWSITVVYCALISYIELQQHGTEESQWLTIDNALKADLAFDHQQILELTLARLRSKVLYTLMPIYLIPEPFTLTQLQRAYEVIMGRKIEKKAFHRRLKTADVLEEAYGDYQGSGRPAAFYQLKSDYKNSAYHFSRQFMSELPDY